MAELLYQKIANILAGKKLIVSDEKQLQAQLMALFGACHELPFIVKEYRLSPYGNVDFFMDGTAVEVKIKGSPMAIHRQLERYAKHPEVKEIILITSKTMTLPATINGLPAHVINISKSWL